MNLSEHIELLNSAQKEAILHLGSPLLILAGPGSGKTRVVTLKIAWLIKECNVSPRSILAMTFTNKAAREMKHRIHELLIQDENTPSYHDQPFISTFHSCGAYLLRCFGDKINLKKDFQIYDSSEQLALLKQAMPNIASSQLRKILSGISKAKDYGLTKHSSEESLYEFMYDNIEIFQKYETLKESTGNVDFGDLLIMPYQLMTQNEEVRAHIQEMWQWYFVDEYQDTNTIQSKWLSVLCQNSANIIVVGDDDQSIYKFRGAILENILRFKHNFANTKIITLGQNYRSSPQIVALANHIISNNSQRHNKVLFSENPDGDMPCIHQFHNEEEEADFVVQRSAQALNSSESIAIFYRINAQSRGYEMVLRRAKLAYTVVGALGFFERMEVKDALALLRIYKNQNDIVSFVRIINKPPRGIGKNSISLIATQMEQGYSWTAAWKNVKAQLTKRAINSLLQLELLFGIGNSVAMDIDFNNTRLKIGDILNHLLISCGLWQFYQKEDETLYTDRIENLKELISYSMEYNNNDRDWNAFFEQIGLNEGISTQTHDNADTIQLITLHRSKGLEFDNVIICGAEDTLIPLKRETEIFTDDDLEEECRLFYVGITRAKKKLDITHCKYRVRYGKREKSIESPFLFGISESLVHRNSTKPSSTSTWEEHDRTDWYVGERIIHSVYGKGYIRKVNTKKNIDVVYIEFDNEYEASFIPQFTEELSKINE